MPKPLRQLYSPSYLEEVFPETYLPVLVILGNQSTYSIKREPGFFTLASIHPPNVESCEQWHTPLYSGYFHS